VHWKMNRQRGRLFLDAEWSSRIIGCQPG
jgi:hypothetical protein